MIKYCFTFIFLLVSNICIAQKQNAVWCFGDSARIDFSNGTQVGKSQVVSRGSCVSICDSNSNLVFYAHTFYVPLWQQGQIDLNVYNKSDTIMQNGVNLIGRGWYKELLILPFIDSANLFYWFRHQSLAKVVFSTQ